MVCLSSMSSLLKESHFCSASLPLLLTEWDVQSLSLIYCRSRWTLIVAVWICHYGAFPFSAAERPTSLSANTVIIITEITLGGVCVCHAIKSLRQCGEIPIYLPLYLNLIWFNPPNGRSGILLVSTILIYLLQCCSHKS